MFFLLLWTALNNIICIPGFAYTSQPPLIRSLIKGIFHLKSPQHGYTEIQDVSTIFQFVDEWGNNKHISLKQMTTKTDTIFLLLSGERINTLTPFEVNHMAIEEFKCVFILSKLSKYFRPCYSNNPVKFYLHEENKNICPVQTITNDMNKQYNNFNKEITNFFNKHKKPFQAAQGDTTSCWVKEETAETGIDIIY